MPRPSLSSFSLCNMKVLWQFWHYLQSTDEHGRWFITDDVYLTVLFRFTMPDKKNGPGLTIMIVSVSMKNREHYWHGFYQFYDDVHLWLSLLELRGSTGRNVIIEEKALICPPPPPPRLRGPGSIIANALCLHPCARCFTYLPLDPDVLNGYLAILE